MRDSHADAVASDDSAAVIYLPHHIGADSDAMKEHREDAVVDTGG